MARASKAISAAPLGSAKSLTTIEQEMAADLATIKQAINAPGGNKIKTQPNGDFILPDGSNIGPEMQIVVVDFVSHNKFYDAPYNPGNPTPPACYAMGKDINAMKPEADSPQMQHGDCRTCPLNQFGSGSNGKSKACKNSRILAVLVVDPENPKTMTDPAAPIYIFEMPPTSIQAFDGAVSSITRSLGLPVKAILTATATPAGTFAKITFNDPMPNPNYALHYSRKGEVQDVLFRKPDFEAAAARAPAPRGRAAPPARRGATAARR